MRFKGKKVKLPWPRWESVEVSPEGIHTTKGLVRPDEISLLQWKAHFYDRGTASLTRGDDPATGRTLPVGHGDG